MARDVKKRKKKKGGFFIHLGLLCILGAFALAGYNLYDAYRAEKATQKPTSHLEQLIMPQATGDAVLADIPLFVVDTPMPAEADDDMLMPTPEENDMLMPTPEVTETPVPTPEPIIEVEVPDYILNPDMDMPETEYEGEKYIGILEIPALELKLPIMSEWSYPRLKVAPCRYTGTTYQRNMVIAAHNYATHFGSLNKLQSGAAVIFYDVDGNRFDYRVAYQETLGPTRIKEMTTGDWDLTLFTCTLGGSYRIAVRCTQVSR